MLTAYETKMEKTLENLVTEYGSIRAGRANPHILDKLKVDYYGAPTPIQGVANVTVPEARTLMITPWEPSMIKEIEKAIINSDLGVNPNNDGRKELVKDIKKKGEAAKVAVRNIRRDANDAFKKMNKASEISEDELKVNEDKVQKLTDKYVAEIDKTIEEKSKEILTV